MEAKCAPAAAVISRWKMSDRASRAPGLIGPNAILQMLPQIEALDGSDAVGRMLERAGVRCIPSGNEMIPESDAARPHQAVRREVPGDAEALCAAAGRDTARYILRHRIPKPVQRMLRLLPPGLAAEMLSKAIARHAWTFAGSGTFHRDSPWRFRIGDNPFIRGEASGMPVCIWHAAVFEHLYRTLVHRDCSCVETTCGAQPGHNMCVFEMRIR